MINLIWLRTFLVLAEQKSFSKTAKRLAMTQPGVSQHIQRLEEHYGSKLLLRFARTCELTPAGQNVLTTARQWFINEEKLVEQLKSDDPLTGMCRFASPGSSGLKLYPLLLNEQQIHHHLTIDYRFAPNSSVERMALAGEIGLGILTHSTNERQLQQCRLGHEKLELLVPYHFKGKTFTDLMNLGFIDHPDGAYHATLVLSANFPEQFHSAEQLARRGFMNQVGMILDPVAAGFGFTVLPASVAINHLKAKKIKTFPLSVKVNEPLFAIWRSAWPLAARYIRLLKIIKKAF